MSVIRTLPAARRRLLLALVCALVLAGRLVGPVLPMPAMAAAMLMEAGICHAGTPAPADDHAPGHMSDCQDCACCHTIAHTGLLPVPVAALPGHPGWTLARLTLPPPATGPPGALSLPFRSRAPPPRSA